MSMITIGDGKPAGQENKTGENSGENGGDGQISKADVEQLINDKVNAAMSTHLTRFKQSFSKDLEANFGKLTSPLAEQMKALSDAFAQREQESEDKSSKKPKDDPVMAELAKANAKIKELEEKNRLTEEEKNKERAQRLRDEERAVLQRVLQDRGVDGAKLRAAMALLYTEEQRVARTEDGKIAFKVQKPGYIEELEMDKGIEEWLKSDEGKEFLPARGAGGAGGGPARGGSSKNGQNGKMSVAEAKTALAQALGVLPKEGA